MKYGSSLAIIALLATTSVTEARMEGWQSVYMESKRVFPWRAMLAEDFSLDGKLPRNPPKTLATAASMYKRNPESSAAAAWMVYRAIQERRTEALVQILAQVSEAYSKTGSRRAGPRSPAEVSVLMFYSSALHKSLHPQAAFFAGSAEYGDYARFYTSDLNNPKALELMRDRKWRVFAMAAASLGYSLMEARRIGKDYILAYPQDPLGHFFLGVAYLSGNIGGAVGKGPWKQAPPDERPNELVAVKHLKRALTLRPSLTEARYNLAASLVTIDRQEALRHAKLFLKDAHPVPQPVLEYLKSLFPGEL